MPGRALTDKHINYFHVHLKKQFPTIPGLQSTLQQYKELAVKLDTGIQIIHCHGYLWVTAHKYAPSVDVVQIYDYLYNTTDNIVKTVGIEMVAHMQKQQSHSNN